MKFMCRPGPYRGYSIYNLRVSTRAIVRAPGRTYPEALTRSGASARDRPGAGAAATQGLRRHAAARGARGDGASGGGRASGRRVRSGSGLRRGRARDRGAFRRRVSPRRGRGDRGCPRALLSGRRAAPAPCLDWGDVLVTEDALFVGMSERSNEAAVEALRGILGPDRAVEGVSLPAGLLHLLSGCAYLGDRRLLAVRALEPFARSRGFDVVPVAEEEPSAANVLVHGKRAVVRPDIRRRRPESRKRVSGRSESR